MGEGVPYLAGRFLPVAGAGRYLGSAAVFGPVRAGPASVRRPRKTVPKRVGLAFLGAFFGSSPAVPAARAAQGLRHGQIPQAGDFGVQIVAPRSITACA